MEKLCKKCKSTLPEEMFAKDSTQKDGLSLYCKECRKQYFTQWYQDVKDDIKRKYRQRNMFVPFAIIGYKYLLQKYGEVTYDTVRNERVRATRLYVEKAIEYLREEVEGGDNDNHI